MFTPHVRYQIPYRNPGRGAPAISIASICPRAYAYGIDLFIRLIFLAAVSSVLGALGKLGGGLMLLIMFGLEWFYPVVLMFLTKAPHQASALCSYKWCTMMAAR